MYEIPSSMCFVDEIDSQISVQAFIILLSVETDYHTNTTRTTVEELPANLWRITYCCHIKRSRKRTLAKCFVVYLSLKQYQLSYNPSLEKVILLWWAYLVVWSNYRCSCFCIISIHNCLVIAFLQVQVLVPSF